jgi:hypothetical protein
MIRFIIGINHISVGANLFLLEPQTTRRCKMAGQPQAPPFLTFDVTSMDVTEPGATALEPFTIIPRNTPFQVSTEFAFTGGFATWLVSLGLTWFSTFYVESIGPGYEGEIGSSSGTTVAGQLNYGLPTTAVSVAGLADPGTYKLTCAITIGTGAAGPPSPIAGFVEGPIIQIT